MSSNITFTVYLILVVLLYIKSTRKQGLFMKLLTFLFLLSNIVLVFATSSLKIIPDVDSKDPIIGAYIDEVSSMSNGKFYSSVKYVGFVSNLPTRQEGVVAGRCEFLYPTGYQIIFNPKTWEEITFDDRIVLVAHELYHCQCKGFGHDDSKDENGCPIYYMGPKMPNPYCLSKYKSRYFSQISMGCSLKFNLK